MTIQNILGASGGSPGTVSAQSGKTRAADAEKFADLLRVAEVGFAQYAREQQELRKLMHVLNTVHAESPPDIREQLDAIVDKLKKDPPKNVEEAYDRIAKFIDAIRYDAPNQLKERMQALFRKVKEMMAEPDDETERLEKLRRSGRLIHAMIG
jgi:type I site-specific restriction endonuclease